VRNLLTAVAVVAIAVVAGAIYLTTRDGSSKDPAGATPQAAMATSGPQVAADDRIIGQAEAPVTIIEYASYTCPHCARFHADILPRLKADFIDKGQARLVFREIVRNAVDIAAAQLLRCAAPEAYFNLVEVLFRSQDSWAFVEKPLDALKQIGGDAGLDPTKMDQCFADEALSMQLLAQNKTAYEMYQVQSTPTIFLNGTKSVPFPYEDYDDAGEIKPGLATSIKKLLPKP
jgi:protein-disulfide isomerase